MHKYCLGENQHAEIRQYEFGNITLCYDNKHVACICTYICPLISIVIFTKLIWFTYLFANDPHFALNYRNGINIVSMWRNLLDVIQSICVYYRIPNISDYLYDFGDMDRCHANRAWYCEWVVGQYNQRRRPKGVTQVAIDDDVCETYSDLELLQIRPHSPPGPNTISEVCNEITWRI